MGIESERGRYESTSVRHSVSNGPDMVREVRWYRDSRHAYRWSKSGNRWIYLGSAHDLGNARYLASQDMYVTHSRR